MGVTSEARTIAQQLAVGSLARAQRIPGLRLLTEKDLLRESMQAIGEQSHLRWLDLPRNGTPPFDVNNALETISSPYLERLHVYRLLGEGRAKDRRPLVTRLASCTRLRDVALESCELRPVDLGALQGVNELDSLSVHWNRDLSLRHVAELDCAKRLQAVDIGTFGTSVMNDDDLARVADLPALEKLRLSWWQSLTEVGAKHLGRARRLRELTLRGSYPVGDASLGAWASDLGTLEKLRLEGTPDVTDVGLSSIARMKCLRALELTGFDYSGDPAVTDAGVERLSVLTNLSTLTLERAGGVRGGSIAALTGLERLILMSCTDEAAVAASTLSHLRALRLTGTFTAPALAHLAGLQSLESLELECDDLADAGFEFIGELTGLTTLRLAGRFGDATLELLARLPRLRKLTLMGHGVSSVGLKHLASLPLREVLIRSDVTADDVATTLGGHPTLRRLTLYGPARKGDYARLPALKNVRVN